MPASRTSKEAATRRAGEYGNLKAVSLLAGLSDNERRDIERCCHWKQYAAGEQIIDRETRSNDVFFVVSGKVRVVNFAASGREVSFDDIPAGGYFGELAAIDGAPRSANVVAIESTLAATLAGPTFLDIVVKHPGVSLAMLKRLASVIRQSTGRIMDLSSLGAHNRIYAELLREARAGGVVDNRAVIKPIPVHGDLAARVSTTRETVARVMGDLARAKLVKREAGALAILDVARLAAMVVEFRGE